MKKIILIFILFSIISCQKNEYSSYKESADISKIANVILSPNTPVLIGDGKAELKFKVKAFTEVSDTRKVEIKKDDQIIVKDSTFKTYIEINNDYIANERVKIYKADGTPISDIYTTTKNIGGVDEFYATIDGIKSKLCQVRIIERPTEVFTPITVPVIFHILHQKKDAFLFTKITSDYLQAKIDRLNNVFAGKEYENAPSTINSNIKFELATTNVKGVILVEKGIDRITISDSENGSSYITKNKTQMIWDLSKFLNVYIHIDADQYSYGAKAPSYILDNGSDLQMDWPLRKVASENDAKYNNYKEVGIEMPQTFLYEMDDLSFSCEYRFETHFGIFYGLLSTGYMPPWSGAKDDFCSDTYTYFTRFSRPEKWTFVPEATNAERKNGDEIYFDSFNIMDNRTKCTTITYEQVLRIRTVMENCPFRMMKK